MPHTLTDMSICWIGSSCKLCKKLLRLAHQSKISDVPAGCEYYLTWHQSLVENWVFHDTHFCQIIRQIESYTAQNKFCQKLPLARFEFTISGSSVWCSDNWVSKKSAGDFWSELSFVSCTTSHVGLCLFLESIEHGFIKVLMIHTHNQIVT